MEGDKFLQVLGFLYFLTTTCYCQTTLTVDKDPVNVGDTVTLTCNLQNFAQGNIIKWERVYQFEDKEEVEQFGSNLVLEDLYKNAGIDRYGFDHKALDGSAVNLILIITGIKVEDSGIFRCVHQDSNSEGRVKIDVLVPPQTISLMVDGQKKDDGSEIEMDAGETHEVECVVDGSNPYPAVSMLLGRKQDGSDGKDKTSLFVPDSQVVYVPIDNQGIKSLRTPSASTNLKAAKLDITGSFGNRYLVCKGSLEGTPTILTSSVYIKFQGAPPEIECSKSLVSFRGQKDINITCSVTADEKPSKNHVSFVEDAGNFTKKMDEDNNVYGLYRYVMEKEKDSNKYFMILKIERVGLQMFRKYTFLAGNDFGDDTYEVSLDRDPSREVTTSSSSIQMCSTFLLMLSFLITLALY